MREVKSCLICGKVFTTYQRSKFCSRPCYRKRRIRIKKTCQLCGKNFEIRPHEREQIYCGKSCSGKVNVGKADRKAAGLKISKSMAGRIPKNIELLMDKGSKFRFKKGQFSREKHPHWKGGITPLTKRIRHSESYFNWIKFVFERDDYTCQICGQKGGELNADHYPKMFWRVVADNRIKSLEEALQCQELWNLRNGRTLCRNCHSDETAKQMKIYWVNQYSESSVRSHG